MIFFKLGATALILAMVFEKHNLVFTALVYALVGIAIGGIWFS